MKRTKALVALLLALVMLVGLCACASKTEEPAKTETPAQTETETPAADDNAAETETPAADESTDAAFTAAADIVAPAGKTLRSLPVDQLPEKQLRIASICVQNNPWGAAVMVGQNFAKEILADRNCVVDVISVDSFDAMSWTSAIENCTASGYDAICIFGVSDELNDCVNNATAAGIAVFCFNGDLPDTDRVAWYGMDDYAAGAVAGQTIVDALPDGGKYAIITGSFSVYGHEKRRTGCRSVTDEVSSLELVGEYENNDDAEKAYSLTTDILNANPDIKAIYVTAGGPSGAAQAIQDAGKSGEVVLVCHDCLSAVSDYIADGTISLCIDQDPFNQGYQPIVDAFNYLCAGVQPEELNTYDAVIATPDNVKELFPELFN